MEQDDASADPLAWIGSDSVALPRTEGGVALCGACFGASQCRLGVGREWLEGEVAVFELTCPRDQEGGPNVAHGGWTAAAMDEMLGHVPLLHNQMSVTATLTVNFRKPVPVQRPLSARAWIDKIEGSKWFISGELTLLPGRSLLATATGIWVARDASHFARHEKWLAEEDAAFPNRETARSDTSVQCDVTRRSDVDDAAELSAGAAATDALFDAAAQRRAYSQTSWVPDPPL